MMPTFTRFPFAIVKILLVSPLRSATTLWLVPARFWKSLSSSQAKGVR
jgi:hypothetical protein